MLNVNFTFLNSANTVFFFLIISSQYHLATTYKAITTCFLLQMVDNHNICKFHKHPLIVI